MAKANIETIEFGIPGDKIRVPRIGFGTMGLTSSYEVADESESLAVLNHAADIGCTFWDTADVYGQGSNKRLVGKVLKDRRSEVFLCTKFGHTFAELEEGGSLDKPMADAISGINGHPDYVRQAVQRSLERLGVDRIDLYIQHRVDLDVPIEDTVRAMAELVKEGKVRYLGLSECSAATLRRAYAVHPIASVQYEYNAWSLDVETNGVLEACRELGVTFVAYSPLGRGFLTGELRSFADLREGDARRRHPRFQPENFDQNLKLVDAFKTIAQRKNITTSQVALAWVLAQEKNLIVIPGTRKIKYLDQNVEASNVGLSQDDLDEIRGFIKSTNIAGERYPTSLMGRLNR
ncbi:hypothetical protein LPJ59_006591 [Coemansia sp. RSA 2399]|nr:hypothetical protein LPJ59_006591 [Coemansia sp. RSA 2399]KAJ1887332.1 hypothetical protein LPJ81_006533 [Coemansia sp. IMI 209127]